MRMNKSTTVTGTVALLVGITACTPLAQDLEATAESPDPAFGTSVVLEEVFADPREDDILSAVDAPFDEGHPPAHIDTAGLRSGGPPPDGIPSINQPRFEPADSVLWLEDHEPVVTLDFNGHHRAYPVRILTWHEIVNDTVDGVPLVITYCPLCNTAIAFDRRVDDRVLSFGVSGMLYNSDLVMFDRQTESLWPQVHGRAGVGHLAGTQLDFVPVTMVPWSQWREEHPDGWVLSRDTGHVRNYGRNPYVGYDEVGSDPLFPVAREDDRLLSKTRIVAFPSATDSVAVVTQAVAAVGAITVEVDDDPIVIVAIDGLASALDDISIAEGREIPWTRSFIARVEGQDLTFEPTVDASGAVTLVDAETGSTWNSNGRAIAGFFEGTQLETAVTIDTFWFAWAAFRGDTTVISE